MPETKKEEKKKKTKKTVTKKLSPKIAKKRVEKITKAKPLPQPPKEDTRYLETIGRRKTAIARVRFWTQGPKEFLVNDKPYQEYFPTFELQQIATAALKKIKFLDRFRIQVRIRGGGLHAQAEAVRHGTARALVVFNPDFRKKLKKAGFLIRDPRMRERKKFGLKRARRAPQWQKR